MASPQRPETREKCAIAHERIQQGEKSTKVFLSLGISSASYYTWRHHNNHPRLRNNVARYDVKSPNFDAYEDILKRFLSGEDVTQDFAERPSSFLKNFYQWRRKYHPDISCQFMLKSLGYRASEHIDKTGCTYQEAADMFGLTRQRVEQIRRKLHKARPLNRKELFQKVCELEAEIARLKARYET